MQRCPYCGSTDLVFNHGRGDTVCGNPACGEILEEKSMVAETSFVQSSSGAVATTGCRVMWNGGGGPSMGQQSNQEMAVARGISKLGYIADRLQLSSQIQEAGRRMLQLAVQMNFNAGRPSRFVACACLYVVCRRSRSPYLLIDFSDVLRSPVKTLGRVYMKLIRRLVGSDPQYPSAVGEGTIEVPIVDPSIFIERFARKLSLGSMQRKVQNTAMRLIQFMHRDWICIGRRPNGLCGAALLVAAFYHGLSCSAKDISDVVRMQEGTLRLRLTEMRETPMALMNRQEFEKADPEAIEDERRALPPCMKLRRRREERAAILDAERRAAILDAEQKKTAAAAITEAGERLALKDRAPDSGAKEMPPPPGRPRAKRRRAVLEDDDTREPQPAGASASAAAAGSRAGAEGGGGGGPLDGALVPVLADRERAEKYTMREPSSGDIEEIARDIASHHSIEQILTQGEQARTDRSEAVARIDDLIAGRPDYEGELTPHSSAAPGEAAAATPQSSLADVDETFSDLDEEELELYLLDEEEQQHKSDIWHEVNKDYLEEWHVRGQEARRRKQAQQGSTAGSASEGAGAADSASETGSASRSRKSKFPPAGSCTQSAMMALAKKGKVGPNRINIEALESLFS